MKHDEEEVDLSPSRKGKEFSPTSNGAIVNDSRACSNTFTKTQVQQHLQGLNLAVVQQKM